MISYTTADLIRRAEEDIAAGKHLLALGLLAEAARREPMNVYIGALVVKADRGIEQVCASPAQAVNDGSVSERRARLASLAIRGEFGDGIGFMIPGSTDPGVEGRVKLLTTVATNLYERGSLEEAVQSLMKAHMLDPKNPHVEACERLLRPALETMRKRPMPAPQARAAAPDETESDRWDISAYLQKKALPTSRPAPTVAADVAPYRAAGESRRLEALRARQDLERKKHEIMQWRRASGPPAQRPGTHTKDVGKQIPPAPQQNTPHLSAFFSKLKQGKLFG